MFVKNYSEFKFFEKYMCFLVFFGCYYKLKFWKRGEIGVYNLNKWLCNMY